MGQLDETVQPVRNLNDVSDAKKVPLFLTSIGSKMFMKLEALTVGKDVTVMSLDDLHATIRAYYTSIGSPYVAEQKLGARTRKTGERVEQYIAELRSLAQKCKFETDKESDKVVRNQIIRGVKHPQLVSQILFAMPLTLTEATKMAVSFEAAWTATTGVDEPLPVVENPTSCGVEATGTSQTLVLQTTSEQRPVRRGNGRGSTGRYQESQAGPTRGTHSWRGGVSGFRGRGPIRRRDGAPIQCYRCGGPHFVRDCPMRDTQDGNKFFGRGGRCANWSDACTPYRGNVTSDNYNDNNNNYNSYNSYDSGRNKSQWANAAMQNNSQSGNNFR
uniref:Retrotransposon gag domain-containing protein n=1 Tax=Strigamia maritima TaxID=126957 RepID=T1IT02_STRMM